MPMPAHPPKNPSSPFSSFRGHQVGIRVPDYEAAKAWYMSEPNMAVCDCTGALPYWKRDARALRPHRRTRMRERR
jgi:hypothetical protein